MKRVTYKVVILIAMQDTIPFDVVTQKTYVRQQNYIL